MPLYTGDVDMEDPDKPTDAYPSSYGDVIAGAGRDMFGAVERELFGTVEIKDAAAPNRPRTLRQQAANLSPSDEFASPILSQRQIREVRETTHVDAPLIGIDDAHAQVKAAGMKLKLPDQPAITQSVLDIMMHRERDRLQHESVVARGPPGSSALDFGTSLLVGMLDPLNIGLSMIPVVGELRYAKLMESAGQSVIKRAAVRGGIGFAQGAAFSAATQPLDWYAASQEGRDYGMADALRNIITGGLLFGGLHVAGGSASDVYRATRGRKLYPYGPEEPFGTPKDIPGLTITGNPEAPLPARAQEDVLRGAIGQMVQDKPVAAAEHLAAAAQSDPRIAAALRTIAGEHNLPAGMTTQDFLHWNLPLREQPALLDRISTTPELAQAFAHFAQERHGPEAANVYSAKPDLFAEREAEGQQQIPGAERVGPGELAQRAADQTLKPKVAQKPADEGLFGDSAAQKSLFSLAPPFHSTLERAVTAAKQERASPEQWLGMLKNTPGVKAEEMDWVGLPDWLKAQKGQVSKQQIADYLRANHVEVREVEKGQHKPTTYQTIHDKTDEDGARSIRIKSSEGRVFDIDKDADKGVFEVLDMGDGSSGRVSGNVTSWSGREPQTVNEAIDAIRDYSRGENATGEILTGTKFSQHVLPGGKNYRELLLTLPERDTVTEHEVKVPDGWGDTAGGNIGIERRGDTGADFRSSHWDEPNVLAHIRFNDRTIDGKKTLFIEEIQSDWHQQARRRGYRDETAKPLSDAEHTELDTLRRMGSRVRDDDATFERYSDLQERFSAQHNRVPDAPFKTTWPELSLKRMIRYAAEHGYEQIAWTPGKVQAERYDLSRQVETLHTFKNENGTFDIAAIPKGRRQDEAHQIAANVQADKLADYIGKDLAEKVAQQGERERIWRDVDLRVGGEGMAGFYDKMLPAAANKLVKKYGVKVGEGNLKVDSRGGYYVARRGGEWVVADTETGNTTEGPFVSERAATARMEVIEKAPGGTVQSVHTLPIPDTLRDAALEHGFPLFALAQRDALTPQALRRLPEIEQMLTSVVRRLVGEHAGAIKFSDKIPFTYHPGIGYGAEAARIATAAGFYRPGERLIQIALMDPRYRRPMATAMHESFHLIEDVLLTQAEMKTLAGYEPEMRRYVQAGHGFSDRFMAGLAPREIRAMAFELYGMARAETGGAPLRLGSAQATGAVRALFDRVAEFFRRIRNALHGMGFRTPEDVFSAAYRGEMRKRAAMEVGRFEQPAASAADAQDPYEAGPGRGFREGPQGDLPLGPRPLPGRGTMPEAPVDLDPHRYQSPHPDWFREQPAAGKSWPEINATMRRQREEAYQRAVKAERDRASQAWQQMYSAAPDRDHPHDLTGAEFFHWLAESHGGGAQGQQAALAALHAAGIPGLRYVGRHPETGEAVLNHLLFDARHNVAQEQVSRETSAGEKTGSVGEPVSGGGAVDDNVTELFPARPSVAGTISSEGPEATGEPGPRRPGTWADPPEAGGVDREASLRARLAGPADDPAVTAASRAADRAPEPVSIQQPLTPTLSPSERGEGAQSASKRTKAALAEEKSAIAEFEAAAGAGYLSEAELRQVNDALAAIDQDTADALMVAQRGAACLAAAVE